MLQDETIARDKGIVCFTHNIWIESGERWGELPEKLLEPKKANANTHNGEPNTTSLTKGNRSNGSSSFLRRCGS